jgi:hypothetical protein
LLCKNPEDLILKDSLTAPREVLNELEKWYDGLSKWARNHKKMFEDLDYDQTQHVAKILKDFLSLVDPNKTTPNADPLCCSFSYLKGLDSCYF